MKSCIYTLWQSAMNAQVHLTGLWFVRQSAVGRTLRAFSRTPPPHLCTTSQSCWCKTLLLFLNSRLTELQACRDARPLREPFTGLRILSCLDGSVAAGNRSSEQGRTWIWSEMRSLRTSIDQIRATESRLADKLSAINRDLGCSR